MITGNIPIDWFDRYYNKKRLCRKPNCKNAPKWPLREYCSEKCRKKFLKYYFKFIEWNTIRADILARDNWKCVFCKKKSAYPHESHDIDHIKPKIVIYNEMVEEYRKLKIRHQIKGVNKRRFWITYLQRINNPKNLRTLCKDCHKAVTADFHNKYKKIRRGDEEGLYLKNKSYDKEYHSMSELSNSAGKLYETHLRYFYLKEEEKEKDRAKLTPEQLYESDMHEYYQDKKNLPYYGFALFMMMVESYKYEEEELKQEEIIPVARLTDYF